MRTLRLPVLALTLLCIAGCTSIGVVSAWLNDQVAFTAPQLQRQLDSRFPRSFDKFGGIVSVTLEHPRLSMPAGDNRLRLDFDIAFDGLGGASRPGHLALLSGLRYEPSTRGLHLQDPELLQFDLPGSNALLQGGARGVVNSLLAEYARSEPVYRIDDDLLSRLPAGRHIGNVEVRDARVVVHLAR
ncbi:DUF1439 domain-containing protein [Luteimonas sp. BDR2-5]|uniref:DUF1439 domain-containing protein n=1 Tax=Proluteimonas luteida TaxID=2878685 RepID=UPI001E36D965|nr:DUF1439 domain-containing protein [Luteimonas sp. BDR2-5]MCD9028179.1 DUF1439 domain-containing protein [Luteimonas sp. BDR2-5]